MANVEFLRRRGRIATLFIAGLVLAALMGAPFSHSSSVCADNGGSSSGGTQANASGAWTDCSAGTDLADSGPGGVHGLFVQGVNRNLNASIAEAVQKYLPSDPTICGFDVVIPWSTIDNGPSASPQYNWSFLDNTVKQWAVDGKIVNLIVWGADEKDKEDIGGGRPYPRTC